MRLLNKHSFFSFFPASVGILFFLFSFGEVLANSSVLFPEVFFDDACTSTTISTNQDEIHIQLSEEDAFPMIRVFDEGERLIFFCWGKQCASPLTTVKAIDGKYRVMVDYFTPSFSHICAKDETVVVQLSDPCASTGGDADNDGICDDFDDCVGDCDTGVTYEGCGVSFTHDGLKLTTEHAKENTFIVFNLNRLQAIFVCDPNDCEDKVSLNLEPGTEYYVLLRTSNDNCFLLEKIETEEYTSDRSRQQPTQLASIIKKTKDLTNLEKTVLQELEPVQTTETWLAAISEKDFTVFPNPANDQLFIDLGTSFSSEGTLHLYNGMGQMIKQLPIPSNQRDLYQLDVSQLNNGLYYLQFEGKGNFYRSEKITIKH